MNSRPSDTPRCAHLVGAVEVRLAAGDADHARAQHRNQLELAGAVRRIGRETRARRRPGRAGCRAGTCRARRPPTCIENSLEQARLQRPHADDEEGAEADREQDDARLVARPRQVQHRVAQRKRPRVRQRRDRARPAPRPARCSTTASAGKPDAHDDADLAATPPARRSAPTSAERHRRSARRSQSSRAARRPLSSRSSSDGLMNRTCSSGTTENSSETSTPIADALRRRAPA